MYASFFYLVLCNVLVMERHQQTSLSIVFVDEMNTASVLLVLDVLLGVYQLD